MNRTGLGWTASSLLILGLACGPESDVAEKRGLADRAPLSEVELRAHTGYTHRLVVKFADERGSALPGGDFRAARSEDQAAIDRVQSLYGLRFEPLFSSLTASDLSALQNRAQERTGVRAVNLSSFVTVVVEADTQLQLEVGSALGDLSVTEFAYLEPLGVEPPGDIAPTTADHVSMQNYLGEDGIDAEYSWSLGAKGEGVRVFDCEYGWNLEHEDLNDLDIQVEPGQEIGEYVFEKGWDKHGTAVFGQLAAVHNDYGMSGMSPAVELHGCPEYTVDDGWRRPNAIAGALARARAGDVILLEMQTSGPGDPVTIDWGGEPYELPPMAPAEVDPVVWSLVKVASDLGIMVVASAGNGAQDLDAEAYQEYRNRGDSGAIIVGAASPDLHDRLAYSTYGSRVALQGWGDLVATLGYGKFVEYGMDKNQRYTDDFGGTSSAAPFVAASIANIQSHAKAELGEILTMDQVRELLVSTGTAQGIEVTGEIGPLPNLRAALDTFNASTAVGLRIVQVSYDTPGTDAVEEFITLYNPTPYAMSVEGWELRDGSGSWVLPAETIEAGGFLVIARDDDGFSELYGSSADLSGMPLALGNSGDSLTLVNDDGEEVDFVAWEGVAEWSIFATTGFALQRVDIDADTDSEADWQAVADPTPGQLN